MEKQDTTDNFGEGRHPKGGSDRMPYLVRIGTIESNVSGVGAQGYGVFRSGRIVTVLYGKVEARGSGRTRFYWRGHPRKLTYPRSTVTRARQLSRTLIREQMLQTSSGKYTKLPKGVRIYSASRLP